MYKWKYKYSIIKLTVSLPLPPPHPNLQLKWSTKAYACACPGFRNKGNQWLHLPDNDMNLSFLLNPGPSRTRLSKVRVWFPSRSAGVLQYNVGTTSSPPRETYTTSSSSSSLVCFTRGAHGFRWLFFIPAVR